MIPLSAEAELVAIVAKKAYDELVKQEDKEMMEDIADAYGPGMLGATAANYGQEHKAFDRKEYKRLVSGMTKAQLLDALINEAEARYNEQCVSSDLRRGMKEAEMALERQKITSSATIHHWKTTAMHLSDAVQSLVTM